LRIATRFSLFLVFALFSLLSVPLRASAALSLDAAAKMLPDRVGEFHALGPARLPASGLFEHLAPEDFGAFSHAARAYVSPGGESFIIELVKTRSDSGAYALLTSGIVLPASSQTHRLNDLGTAGIAAPGGIAFFRGPAFVTVYGSDKKHKDEAGAVSFARLFAETMDKGEGEVPVLVKHLPEWESAQERAIYAISLGGLERVVGNQPVLEAVSFEGGAEAVTSVYGSSKLVIVEYTTPQISIDSDARITERIRKLQGAGQPVPSAYRRVGNYSVFVFDAPDERAAAQLIDQISYEQVVQWLGTNPHILERMQREYVNTMGGTILAVLKASGLSLILCFGIGGLVGALVFQRRRAQAAATDAYSDAGGMLRLNIDEMSQQTDPGRLLGRGDG
jgi:hypothetical protein